MIIRKGAVLTVLLICLLVASSGQVEAASSRSIVVYRIGGCDYFVVETRVDYAVLEWYGDHDPDKGDVLVGNISEYGMRTILDETADESLTAWVDEYGLNKTDALEQLVEHCE